MRNPTIDAIFFHGTEPEKKGLLSCTSNPNRSFIWDHLSTIGYKLGLLLPITKISSYSNGKL